MLIAFDDSISRMFKLMMEKKPTLDFYLRYFVAVNLIDLKTKYFF
jgi:hypothetical protein